VSTEDRNFLYIGDLSEIEEIVPTPSLESLDRQAVVPILNGFNNYLLILNGRSNELLGELKPSSPLYTIVGEIWDAAKHLARFTEKLQRIVEATPESFCGRGTLLVVDDEEAVRAFLVASLQQRGYTVHEAQDGARAIQILSERKGEIELVLSDVDMQPMDGYKLYRQLCRTNPHLKVILMSGLPLDHRRVSGRVDFLQKPFPRPNAHIEKVWRLLNQP
jgi:CheY-like chemotaxis protein